MRRPARSFRIACRACWTSARRSPCQSTSAVLRSSSMAFAVNVLVPSITSSWASSVSILLRSRSRCLAVHQPRRIRVPSTVSDEHSSDIRVTDAAGTLLCVVNFLDHVRSAEKRRGRFKGPTVLRPRVPAEPRPRPQQIERRATRGDRPAVYRRREAGRSRAGVQGLRDDDLEVVSGRRMVTPGQPGRVAPSFE